MDLQLINKNSAVNIVIPGNRGAAMVDFGII